MCRRHNNWQYQSLWLRQLGDKMTHKISIADALTGETIEREMTADELAIYEADTARRLKIYQAAEKANAEKG